MRKVSIVAIVIALFVGLAGGETSAADNDLAHMKERLDAQARRIKSLEAHVAILRKKVKKLKQPGSKPADKKEAADKGDDTKAKEKEQAGLVQMQLFKINGSLDQWDGYHYIDYKWQQRKGWDVVQGMEKKAAKLVGSKECRWSRLMHKRKCDGNFAVVGTVLARGSARLEIVHPDKKMPYKKGLRMDFPDGKPAKFALRRRDGKITAHMNNEKVEVAEKHYGGDQSKPCYVALTVDKGDELLVRNVQILTSK